MPYAIDRAKIARLYGGAVVATPHCQALAPGLPGFHRYCPHTEHPHADGTWSAPDLQRARRLVEASGTRGEQVDVWGPTDNIGIPRRLSAYIAGVLTSLGYRARLHLIPAADFTPALRRRIQLSVDGDWLPNYPRPSAYLPQFFGCRGGTSSGYVCDPRLDRAMARAESLQDSDPRAAAALWSHIRPHDHRPGVLGDHRERASAGVCVKTPAQLRVQPSRRLPRRPGVAALSELYGDALTHPERGPGLTRQTRLHATVTQHG